MYKLTKEETAQLTAEVKAEAGNLKRGESAEVQFKNTTHKLTLDEYNILWGECLESGASREGYALIPQTLRKPSKKAIISASVEFIASYFNHD